MTSTDPAAALSELLSSHGLTRESRLYRYTLDEFLAPAEGGDGWTLSANPAAGEAVVDIYAQGHVTVAEHLGPGLAFATSADDWQESERALVEVRLGDVLDQNGRLYPVESVVTCQVFYCTLPAGSVLVRKVDA
jgi:hypothetical protein